MRTASLSAAAAAAGVIIAAAALAGAARAAAADVIPPGSALREDRPRLLIRPADTTHAISLKALRAISRDDDFKRMLGQLEGLRENAAAQALAHLLTGEARPAERALALLQSWKATEDKEKLGDPFHVWFTLQDLALAYDWLHDHPGFDAAARGELRRKVQPLVEGAVRLGEDHVFHNYIWMFDGGAMLWALATAGEDPAMDRVYAALRDRFNRQLFRAMEYLGGANGDSAGYWWLYCFASAERVLLAAQSASETDLVGAVHRQGGDWFARQVDGLVHGVLPDLRFVPWGDIVGGANGGVTHEMAGEIDAAAWALRSPHAAFLSRALAAKRGLERFYGETAIDYFLYTRNLAVDPAPPPLSVRCGGPAGGHVLLRSDWTDGATFVGFRCTDFFGQHHHLDQGSFVIDRNGWLALDAGTYKNVSGPQSKTDAHSTLLIGGEGQRKQTYQSASTLDDFTGRLPKGLDTGDLPFFRDAGEWAAASGQFAQAYSPEVVRSCVRQVLFVRPGAIVVVDQIAAPEGKKLPEVRWLLQLPGKPSLEGGAATATNGKSWLRCRDLLPGVDARAEPSLPAPAGPVSSGGNPKTIDTTRLVFTYRGEGRLTLAHLIEVGDGAPPEPGPPPAVRTDGDGVHLALGGKTFLFSVSPPEVSAGAQ
jgi:heparinase II/III-like protein